MFNLNGTIVRWPDGTGGTILQDDFTRDWSRGGVHAYIASLSVKRQGLPDLKGALRFTEEAYHRLPGTTDAERTSAVARRLTGLIATQGLTDGFFLKVDADDSGVQIVDTSR
jgi:hypothetical protein